MQQFLEDMRKQVGEEKVRGGKNHGIIVPVGININYVQEVVRLWRQHLDSSGYIYKDKSIRVHAKRSPAIRRLYGLLGKAKDCADDNFKGTYYVSTYGSPEFCVYLYSLGSSTKSILVEVAEGVKYHWKKLMITVIGSSVAEEVATLAAFDRK